MSHANDKAIPGSTAAAETEEHNDQPAGAPVAAASEALAPLEEAYLAHAGEVRALVGELLTLFPLGPRRHDEPGRDLTDALWLRGSVDRLVAAAVVVARERGASWEEIAAAANMKRQNAHRRWAPLVRAWAVISGRRHLDAAGRGGPAAYAADLDAWFAVLTGEPHAFTDGLTGDPDDRPAAAADRTQARALRARLHELHAVREAAWQEFAAAIAEPGRDAGAERGAWAAAHEDTAAVYDQLAATEPVLADEHRSNARALHTLAVDIRRGDPTAHLRAAPTASKEGSAR